MPASFTDHTRFTESYTVGLLVRYTSKKPIIMENYAVA